MTGGRLKAYTRIREAGRGRRLYRWVKIRTWCRWRHQYRVERVHPEGSVYRRVACKACVYFW